MNQTQKAWPHVVILGGGFAGLYAARTLRNKPVRVTLIDRQNYHLFQPLLYQVATGTLNPSDIAHPLRNTLRKYGNVRVLLGEATDILPEERKVVLANGDISYDYLMVATGATHSYFGHDQWADDAPGLKTVEDALEIRHRVYLAYEAAELEQDPELRCEWLTFVVIGAGPTGVELAGALSEVGRHSLARDFRSIDPRQVRVLLLEGKDRVLPLYPPDLSAKAHRQLQELGVEVRTGSMATDIDERGVTLGDEQIKARTVLWAAGVEASPLARALNVPLDKAGRVIVEYDLSIPGRPEIFVVGDLARATDPEGDVPGVAPAAIQMGRHAARNILRRVEGRPTERFDYWDKGNLATIGRAAGVADLGPIHFGGWLAWISWLAVHIFFLIGFRNRVWVLLGWAWSYVTYQRGVRLITRRTNYDQLPPVGSRPQGDVMREHL